MILLHHMILYVTLLHCLTWPYTNHMWHYNFTCTRCTNVFLLVHMFTGREGTQQRWRGPNSPWLFFLLDFVSVTLYFNSTSVNACGRNLWDNFWRKLNVLVLLICQAPPTVNKPGSSHCFVVQEPGSEVKLHPFLQCTDNAVGSLALSRVTPPLILASACLFSASAVLIITQILFAHANRISFSYRKKKWNLNICFSSVGITIN